MRRSLLPSLFASSPTLTAGAVLAAAIGIAGCVTPEFQPRSSASNDISEPGVARASNTRERAPRAVFTESNPSSTAAGQSGSHPANQVMADDLDLPFIRANQVPGVNVFGEFGDEGMRPFADAAGRAGFQQHTYVDEGFDTDVTVDPSGQWMAFASTRHSQRSDIYLQRTNGLAVTKLTSDPADDAFPVFSPDGKRIAFCSNRSGNWDVYVMDVDGQNVTAVTQSPTHELHPSFSPDGSRVVYSSVGGRSGQWELWVADLTSGERTMMGFGLFPSWSPRTDRDVIAFQRARQRGGRWFSLWTLELVDGEPLNVTEIAVSPNAALVAPTWSPDGRQIAFATVVDPEAGETGVPGQQDIWTVYADGTNRHRMTDGKGVYATPYWATDGRIYFVSDRGGTEAIWSARADGPNYSEAAIDVTPVGR